MFNGVEQMIEGSARLIFATDSGVISAWPSSRAHGTACALLVGNFGGHDRIAAYGIARNRFIGFSQDPEGRLIEIEGLWGPQFGNGASLEDANALYFAAGPKDQTQGLFGVLRYAVD